MAVYYDFNDSAEVFFGELGAGRFTPLEITGL
jgi:hypothetical protein